MVKIPHQFETKTHTKINANPKISWDQKKIKSIKPHF